jgi:hypothetical protein
VIYVVFYEIIGSRCNGSYLVNAKDKREAKKLVLAVDEDYVCRGDCVEKVGKYDELKDLTETQLFEDYEACFEPGDIKNVEQEGSVYQLECGT